MHCKLNITQAKHVLSTVPSGTTLTAADGIVCFEPKQAFSLGYQTYILSDAAIAYLRRNNLVRFKSLHGHYALWEKI